MRVSDTFGVRPASDETDREALARLFIEAFPALDAGQQRLALALYRRLAEGRAVATASLASSLGRSLEGVQHTLSQWPGVFYDGAGHIVGFWGMTVTQMRHRLEVNGNTVYAWCAWDTLFLPGLLGESVAVLSPCAQTGEPVRLAVSPQRIDCVDPASVVVSFLKPDERSLRESALTSFCHFVHFFRDREAGEHWTGRHPGTFLLALEEAFDLGQRVNATRYRDVLQPLGVIRT